MRPRFAHSGRDYSERAGSRYWTSRRHRFPVRRPCVAKQELRVRAHRWKACGGLRGSGASFRSTPRMNGIGAAVTMRTYRFDPPVTAGGSVRTTTGRLPPAGGRNDCALRNWSVTVRCRPHFRLTCDQSALLPGTFETLGRKSSGSEAALSIRELFGSERSGTHRVHCG